MFNAGLIILKSAARFIDASRAVLHSGLMVNLLASTLVITRIVMFAGRIVNFWRRGARLYGRNRSF